MPYKKMEGEEIGVSDGPLYLKKKKEEKKEKEREEEKRLISTYYCDLLPY